MWSQAGGAASSADDGSNIWAVLQRETERMVADASSMEEEHPALASYVSICLELKTPRLYRYVKLLLYRTMYVCMYVCSVQRGRGAPWRTQS
jgi:hypothetical protein